MAIEFATGYVTLLPSLKGAGKSISSQIGGLNMAPAGKILGAKLGAKMGGGLKASMKSQVSGAILAPVNAALERQSSAMRNLSTAERDLTKARAGQQTAQAKVAKAEEKLATLRDSGTATSAELKGAEADLNTAKVALADTNLKVGSAEDTATRAKEAATDANGAYVESLKKSSTFTGRLETALPVIGDRIKAVGGKWQNAGKQISGVGGSLTKKITAPVGIAATAVGGLTAALGWGRLTGLDSAKAQLEGLGYSAEDVGKITGQVTEAIDGGMTTMAEGTSVAAGALAAGVDEGKDLKDYIERVGNAAAGANRPVGEMAQIFNRVQGGGKLMTQELNMVEQGMPGFAAAMAKSLGVPQEEFRKMVTAGEVSSDDFMGVMDDFAGEMAESQANSWDGLVKNTMAYVGIIGEALLGGVFGDAKTAIKDFQGWLKSDDIQAWAADMGAKIGETFSKIVDAVRGAITWWQNLSPAVKSGITGFAGFLVVAGPVLLVVGKIVTGIGGLITAFGSIVSAVRLIIPVVKALNLVMMASPLGLVIALVAAIAAGLIYFFTQTELGKEIWGGFVNWLKDLWSGISEFFTGLWAGIQEVFTNTWSAIVEFFTSSGDGIGEWWNNLWTGIGDFFRGFWEGLKSFIGAGIEFIKNLFFTFNPLGIIIANWGPIVAWVKGLFAKIKAGISAALAVIRSVITSITSGIASAWSSVWNGIKAVASAVWSAIVSFVTSYINTVRAVITAVVSGIASVWSSAWNGIKAVVTAVFGAIKSFISGAMNGIRNVIVGLVNGVRAVWTAGWNTVKSAFVSVVRGIVSAVSSFVSSVKSKFSAVLSFVSGIPGKLVGFFSGMGSRLVESGRALIGGLLDGIMAGFRKAKDAVAGGLSKIRNLFPFSPAKEGPFSGRGWVAYSGLSIGETFSDSVADSLKDGRDDVADELGGIQDEFDDFNDKGFRVGTSVPDFEPGGAAGGPGGGAAGGGGPVIHVENMTVDSDNRVKQVGQELYARAARADRARGAVQMGGATV
ncbi:tape measure protein [Arthrobacter rhombi]|uniref:tape measure protein n=1 Tax=Arthrobacter rhombi TaxID=71253 RepID=UPI003FD43C63